MKMLSTKNVAVLFNVSPDTVRTHAEKGKLPFLGYKIGKQWRFKGEDVYSYVYGDNWKEKVPNEDSQRSATCPDKVPEQVAGSESAD